MLNNTAERASANRMAAFVRGNALDQFERPPGAMISDSIVKGGHEKYHNDRPDIPTAYPPHPRRQRRSEPSAT